MRSKLPYILIAEDNDKDRDAWLQEFERHIVYAAVEHVENNKEILDVLDNCRWCDYPAMVILSNTDDSLTAREAVNEISAKPYSSDLKIILLAEPGIENGFEASEHPAAVSIVQKPAGGRELTDVVSQIDKMLIEELQF